ncbi:MAG: hypothetical protein EHM12_08240 [Dehalococcoidia bacterium]|nr:MAG: hypothetical protein EHM12_08240 [Dehalococcoidia bacterium]
MRVRSIDVSNNWSFGKGKSNYKSDIEAIKQNIATRIKSWKGNCFFAKNDGVDWTNYFDIGMKNYLDIDIRRVILQTDGVIRIDSYESEMTDRAISITANVVTIYGNTAVIL